MNTKTFSIVAGVIAAFASTAALAADEYTLNQNMPSAAVSTNTPAAVQAVVVNEYQRNQNAVAPASSRLQRAQVIAEAIEARKLGLLNVGEGTAPTATPSQLEQIRLAGVRAVGNHVAAK